MKAVSFEFLVITKNPSDFPGKFVVRRHIATAGSNKLVFESNPIAVVDSLLDAREFINMSTYSYVPRVDGDDPVIFESWMRRL